jgi:hypothetical protein
LPEEISRVPDVFSLRAGNDGYVHIDISITGTDPPTGTVASDGIEGRPFEGWLALIAEISDLLGEPRR